MYNVLLLSQIGINSKLDISRVEKLKNSKILNFRNSDHLNCSSSPYINNFKFKWSMIFR